MVLGIIDPDNFFGGRHPLDRVAAEAAIDKHVAQPLGLSVQEAAAGIYEVVTAKMGDLIRKVTIESGNDPQQFCLLAYGGASGAHCASFSAQLGIRRVIIPYTAPVFSAFGCAFSDILCSHSKSDPVRLTPDPEVIARLNGTFASLKAQVMADMRAIGVPAEDLTIQFKVDLRYEGQMNEVALPWSGDVISDSGIKELRQAFETLYEQRFGAGTTHGKSALEVITLRAEGLRQVPKPPLAPLFEAGHADAGRTHEPKGRRSVYRHGEGWIEAAVYDFGHLLPDRMCCGPAIVERQNTTIWLPPESDAIMDIYGNLTIKPGA